MIIPVPDPLSILGFIEKSVRSADRSLKSINIKLDAQMDGALIGTILSIQQAKRLGDTDRIRAGLGDLFKLSGYYRRMYATNMNSSYKSNSITEKLLDVPGRAVTIIARFVRLEVQGAEGYSKAMDSIEGLYCINFFRYAEIAKIVCYQMLEYRLDGGATEIRKSFRDVSNASGLSFLLNTEARAMMFRAHKDSLVPEWVAALSESEWDQVFGNFMKFRDYASHYLSSEAESANFRTIYFSKETIQSYVGEFFRYAEVTHAIRTSGGADALLATLSSRRGLP